MTSRNRAAALLAGLLILCALQSPAAAQGTDLAVQPDRAAARAWFQDAKFGMIVSDRKQVTHVAKLHDMEEFKAMKPFLREAFENSIS